MRMNLSFVCVLLVWFGAGLVASEQALEPTIETLLRFPRHKHLREDDWKEFSHLVPRLRRWEKENNTVEHDPVNMEEKPVLVHDASQSGFTVRFYLPIATKRARLVLKL